MPRDAFFTFVTRAPAPAALLRPDLARTKHRRMGRVKIPMEYRTDPAARRVTLCKRKRGLYKKAEEIAKLCGVEVCVVIVGDTCKPAQYVATGSGEHTDVISTERVLRKYRHMVHGLVLDATDTQKTLDLQSRQLELQRREIEELRGQLQNERSARELERELPFPIETGDVLSLDEDPCRGGLGFAAPRLE